MLETKPLTVGRTLPPARKHCETAFAARLLSNGPAADGELALSWSGSTCRLPLISVSLSA